MCIAAGATKAGGGGLATSAVDQNGSTIDLTDMPLQYGKDDSALSPAQRNAIEDFEKRRQTAKVEYAKILDANGNPTMPEKSGGKGGVRTTMSDWYNGEVMSHNHPRSESSNVLGGTFSYDDLNTFTMVKAKTMRAAASEGTYSITKGKNFNASGFKNYAAEIENKHYGDYKKTAKSLGKQLKTGSITYNEYLNQNNKAFNKMLVDSHNELLAGQKKYGYNYTLERRK